MQHTLHVAGIAIAIPARDEAMRLPRCLRALARQIMTGFSWPDLTVIVIANNCTDDTAAVARAMAPALPFRLSVQEIRLVRRDAHAGGARAAAMRAAARYLKPRGTLISTDADAEPAPSWLAAKLAARAAGADAVAGAIDLHAGEFAALPPALRGQLSLEIMYAEALDQLAALVDPEPQDPWPRHHWHSGASMALSRDAWDRIGGLPRVRAGEDRALFAAVRRAGLLVRHEPQARVTVSCRLDGRAFSGMADTLKRRLAAETDTADTRLEPAGLALQRLRCRHGLRRLWEGQGAVSAVAALCRAPPESVRGALGAASFWAAWEALETVAPGLRRLPLRLRDLAAELRAARRLIATRTQPGAARRYDNAAGAGAAAGMHPDPAPP